MRTPTKFPNEEDNDSNSDKKPFLSEFESLSSLLGNFVSAQRGELDEKGSYVRSPPNDVVKLAIL